MNLKSIFTLTGLLVFATLFNQVIAQTPDETDESISTSTGRIILQPYVGGPNMKKWAYDVDDYNDINSSGSLHYGIAGEFSVSERIGLGFDVIYSPFSRTETAYNYYTDPVTGDYISSNQKIEITDNKLRIMPRIFIHFNVEDPTWDIYISGGVGFNIINSRYEVDGQEVDNIDSYGYYDSFPIISPHFPFAGRFCFGSRYYINNNLGINFETGVGGPVFSLGMNLRF